MRCLLHTFGVPIVLSRSIWLSLTVVLLGAAASALLFTINRLVVMLNGVTLEMKTVFFARRMQQILGLDSRRISISKRGIFNRFKS